MELTRILADKIVSTEYDMLPQEIQEKAKERLLDTIGAMIAGRSGWGYAEALLRAVKPLGTGNTAPIGPAEAVYPPARTAMLNATFAHAIELDDGHKFAGNHAGAVVVPTALAIGEAFGREGKEILTAIVLGYEMAYRLAAAQAPKLIDRGFHPSAVCDTPAAAVVAGKLMGLDREQMASCLGMAGLGAAGLMEATVSGQQSKCVMVGNAAMSGITCAYIAKENLEGCYTVYEGKSGLFQAMSGCPEAQQHVGEYGSPWQITETYSKFYPTCRHSQPAIEAALNEARAHNLDYRDVDHVEVGTHHVAMDLTGKIRAPKNPGEAKFSIAYGVAAALIDRGVAVRHLTDAYYTDPKYLELAAKVTTTLDEEVDSNYPKRRGARVKIIMKDGTEYGEECYDLKGSPQNPVGYEAIADKFVTSATGILREETIEQVMEYCETFENVKSVGEFRKLLCW